MLRSTTLPLLVTAALTLATAGCSMEMMDRVGVATLPTAPVAEPVAGHEVHMMFHTEKRNAAIGEIPSQF